MQPRNILWRTVRKTREHLNSNEKYVYQLFQILDFKLKSKTVQVTRVRINVFFLQNKLFKFLKLNIKSYVTFFY